MDKWIVVKFGGTSVSSLARWNNIKAILKDRIASGYRPVLVCSAIAKVSNLLEGLISNAVRGNAFAGDQKVLEARHQELIRELGVGTDLRLIQIELAELNRLLTGLSLLQEATPRTHAQVMALGELMLTRIGAAFLTNEGMSAQWIDARQIIKTATVKSDNFASEQQSYLSAQCPNQPDEAVQNQLRECEQQVIITQGFIASNRSGDTVLLGRGGSDISAGCIGALLEAAHVEIWTDVPGMFTANPHEVPTARLLTHLDYEEALELATSGAKVLHPRAIEPARRSKIPLWIKWTQDPSIAGTCIASETNTGTSGVKAVIDKAGVIIISMDSLGMWQEVGFLARVFTCFKDKGLSIDCISTSQSNVTVTLDPIANYLNPAIVDDLLYDLSEFCRAKKIGPCSTVSLVGKNLRAVFPQLAPALQAFQDKRIHLVSQAASDLNFTFAVDNEDAGRIVANLHALFFPQEAKLGFCGPSWRELNHAGAPAPSPENQAWWITERDRLLKMSREHSPRYIYHRPTIEKAIGDLKKLKSISRLNFAMKSNSNAEVLKICFDHGLAFDCVSLAEVALLRKLFPAIKPDRILFTPNFAPIGEYVEAIAFGCYVTLDNLHPLEQHPEVFKGREVLVRLDPSRPSGHHRYVQTAGNASKFGITVDQIPLLQNLVSGSGAKVIGLHAHVGSGIMEPTTWAQNAHFLVDIARQFSGVRILDLGGGLGVAERSGQRSLDLKPMGDGLQAIKGQHPEFEFWLEPGRFLVADSGVLLSRVTQLKTKGPKRFVGCDTGMNSLIRYPLYGAFHEIVNLDHLGEPDAIVADIVGPICESGDVLGQDRSLPATEEGDTLLIAKAGAYGFAMGSSYNLRPPAEETMI